MSRWLFAGLSEGGPSPGEDNSGRRLAPRGERAGVSTPPACGGGGGLVSAEQARKSHYSNQKEQQCAVPQALTPRPRQPVVIKDLYPVREQTFHSLDDFCIYNPDDPDKSPGLLDLLFFNGDSVTSILTRVSGWLSWGTGRKSNGSFSHTGVAYVGSDGRIGLFEAVNEPDTLFDLLGNRPNSSGVRLVGLRERIISYARKKEIYTELADQSRIIKVGVMRFRFAIPVDKDRKRKLLTDLVARFEVYQDRVKYVAYTQNTHDLLRAQLPQIFGTSKNSDTVAGMFCSKLACQVYMAVGVLDPRFPADQETPSTLASQTLPFVSQFSLGPELYQIYISVPRSEWDAELQLARLQASAIQEAKHHLLTSDAIDSSTLPPAPGHGLQYSSHVEAQRAPPRQFVSQPEAATRVPLLAALSPEPSGRTTLFLEGGNVRPQATAEPSLEQLLIPSAGTPEVFQGAGSEALYNSGETEKGTFHQAHVPELSSATTIVPSRPVYDPDMQSHVIAWMKAYNQGNIS